jgi:hypothetical protein
VPLHIYLNVRREYYKSEKSLRGRITLFNVFATNIIYIIYYHMSQYPFRPDATLAPCPLLGCLVVVGCFRIATEQFILMTGLTAALCDPPSPEADVQDAEIAGRFLGSQDSFAAASRSAVSPRVDPVDVESSEEDEPHWSALFGPSAATPAIGDHPDALDFENPDDLRRFWHPSAPPVHDVPDDDACIRWEATASTAARTLTFRAEARSSQAKLCFVGPRRTLTDTEEPITIDD